VFENLSMSHFDQNIAPQTPAAGSPFYMPKYFMFLHLKKARVAKTLHGKGASNH